MKYICLASSAEDDETQRAELFWSNCDQDRQNLLTPRRVYEDGTSHKTGEKSNDGAFYCGH